MIGKLIKGTDFAPLLRYLFRGKENGEPRGVLLGGTLAGESPEELAAELRTIAALRARVTKPVRHLSISLLPGEHLTAESWLLAAADVAREMGWDSYAVVQHHDRPHEHVHIVATRVRADGSIAREHLRDFRKVESALRIIEEQFGLEPVPSPTRSGRTHQRKALDTTRLRGKERALAERTRAPTKKQQFRAVIDEAITAAQAHPHVRPFPQFLEELKVRGVIATLNIRGARITGIG